MSSLIQIQTPQKPDVSRHPRSSSADLTPLQSELEASKGPEFWRSPLRGPWLTSILGSALLPLIVICAVTGFLSHIAYFPDLGPALVPDSAGFLSIDPAKLHAVFAHDVSPEDAAVMGATQKPIAGSAFSQSVEAAAWKHIPSYYLVATGDRAIKPELQRHMAQRIGARVTEVDASHVPFLSQPEAVARVILDAAANARN